MSSVLQTWVTDAPWKCQSILFSGLRGPDHAYCPFIKQVSRWLRMISQYDADPTQSYMAVDSLPRLQDLEKELEFSSVHFVHHLADALRVVGIYHPDAIVKANANGLHRYIADELFHFKPEGFEEFIHRHRDRVEHG
jgi:hypothetical protein